MATVTMDLTEIDKLRDDLKEATRKVKELESTQMQVEVTTISLHNAPNYYNKTIGEQYREISKKYISLDEVRSTIRKEEYSKVQETLKTKDSEHKNLKDFIEKARVETEKIILELKKEISVLKGEAEESNHVKHIETLRKSNDQLLNEMQRLITEIKTLKNRNFWERLFNFDMKDDDFVSF